MRAFVLALALLAAASPAEKAHDVAEVAFADAMTQVEAHDWKAAVALLQKFVAKYERAPAQAEHVFRALGALGEAWDALGQPNKSVAADAAAARAFETGKLGPGDNELANLAARCAFRAAEPRFDAFSKMPFPHGDSFAPSYARLMQELVAVEAGYADVAPKYKSPSWSLAALVRIASADERFVDVVRAVPCPREIAQKIGERGCTEFNAQLVTQTAPILERAKTVFSTVVQRGAELGLANEWTLLARKGMCRLQPERCLVP